MTCDTYVENYKTTLSCKYANTSPNILYRLNSDNNVYIRPALHSPVCININNNQYRIHCQALLEITNEFYEFVIADSHNLNVTRIKYYPHTYELLTYFANGDVLIVYGPNIIHIRIPIEKYISIENFTNVEDLLESIHR